MNVRKAIVASLAIGMSACTTHPLPEDVTGLNTQTIVRQIRCESRQAIIEVGIDWLMQRSVSEPDTARALQPFLDSGDYRNFHYNLFRGDTRRILQLFFDTGIAYNYRLTMREANGLGGGLNLTQPLPRGLETLNLAGSASLQRQNLRTFTITDSFSKLVRNLTKEECAGSIVRENFVYPIAGRVGMKPVIADFVHLTLLDNLGGDGKNGQGPPTMVDSLDFQTTLSVNGGPSVVFTPAGRGLSLGSASLGLSASRSDTHNLTVGLALPSTATRLAKEFKGAVVTPLLLSAQGGRSELDAANAVNQVIAQRALNPLYFLGP